MKRLLVLFLALALIAGFAFAEDEDEGIGLTVGLEFGVENITDKGSDDRVPYLMPMIIYDNSFGAFDIYAELDYIFGFTKTGDKFPQDLYFDLVLTYNLGLGDASTLSFIVENENDTFQLSPWVDASSNISGIVKPGIKFTQGITDFGDLYVQADVPIGYTEDPLEVGIDAILGWDSTFGLGIKVVEHNTIKPDADYAGLDVIVSYESGPVYCEVEVDIPKDAGADGVVIIPEFDLSFNAFTFYVNCSFEGVGSGGDVIISPALGIKYSF